MKTSAKIQLQGFAPANRDALVQLTHQATGKSIQRKPFLDGSLVLRDLDPGDYQLKVVHPNLINPIDDRRVRIFPQPHPTFLPVPVRPDLFRDTPIRDIPDADLAPVQQAVGSVTGRLAPIAEKQAGEAIRAADWRTLTGAVGDLASAVLELTHLVSPLGHPHPEIAEKIDEVQGNLRRFGEAFGRSLLELRREIETLDLEKTVREVLDSATEVTPEIRDRFTQPLVELPKLIQGDTPTFTGKLSSAGHAYLNGLNDLAQAQGDGADAFRATPAVTKLVNFAQRYTQSGSLVSAEAELKTYERTGAQSGGRKLMSVIGS